MTDDLGRPYLPTDLPPGARAHIGPTNVAGLITHTSSGEHFYPLYTPPFAPLQSAVFPLSQPSKVAPNGLRPKWGVAINAYSPIAHRNTLSATVPPAAIRAGGVGRVTQRPRNYAPGYVTRWPQLAPRWPTWPEAKAARG